MSDIKITARILPTRPNACRYTVDRPVFENGSAYFSDKKKSSAAPLAEKLFALDQVTAVRIEGHDVTVVRGTSADWKEFSVNAARVLRAQISSGVPAVSPEYRADLKGEAEMKNKVQMLFETQINPAVAGHGGVVELIDVKDGRVYLRMGGGCQGCGSANLTLRQGIETTLREELPEIDEILDVTDHASGSNPYYQ